MPKGSGKMMVLVLGAKDKPMKKAKGGMVKRKSAQIKGWGCARRGA